MSLLLHDTMSRAKRPFVPADPLRVTMYVCGPTPYNHPHIGNARTAIVFDLLFRVLRDLYGEEHVLHVRNITDVEDKLIAKAHAEGVPFSEIAARFTQVYRDDMAALGALAPNAEPTVTGHMPGVIAFIADLVARGAAYRAQSGVYFDVAADADYGRLSRRAQEDLLAGARVTGEEDKRAPSDFALWKAAKPGEPSWESPWGPGRPGWHIECSAMIRAELGETIDIHGGGADLIFPHHENEIAQSESVTGHPLARYWMHAGFLTMNAEKMSKSLGNVVLVRDLLPDWPGEAIRWALLAAHYRAPLDFNDGLLQQAKASLDRLYGALARAADIAPAPAAAPAALREAVHDDLNTPRAFAELFALASALNNAAAPEQKAQAKGELLAAGALLGFLSADPASWLKGQGADDAEIEALIAARAAARQRKDFAEADRIRAELAARGVEVMDGAAGGSWRRL